MNKIEPSLGTSGSQALLDCTFRDGGYYNNWDFSDDLFQQYLNVMDRSQFEFAEVGFRFAKNRGLLGPHAYSTDGYLRSFDLPSRTKIGVMINAGEFNETADLMSSLRQLFVNSEQSPLDFVRIAAHERELTTAISLATKLLEMGYQAAINLMQISEVEETRLPEILSSISNLDLFAFYVADSLGSMTPGRVANLFDELSSRTHLRVGIHAHDNLGLALENSLTALKHGASYVDGTMSGMGRGPGNTKSEELAIALCSPTDDSAQVLELAQFSLSHFSGLKQELGWGGNVHYFLAGLKGVHPTYVQEVLSDSRFDEASALNVVHKLSNLDSSRFDPQLLRDLEIGEPDSTTSYSSDLVSDWTPTSAPAAVVIGPADISGSSSRALRVFLAEHPEFLVLSVNGSPTYSKTNRTFRVISHPRQAALISEHLNDPEVPWIVPVARVQTTLRAQKSQIYNYNFAIGPTFKSGPNGAISPVDNVFSYACAIALECSAKKIYVAGFDGLSASDHRNFEMVSFLGILSRDLGVEVQSLTPSNLPVETTSVFTI